MPEERPSRRLLIGPRLSSKNTAVEDHDLSGRGSCVPAAEDVLKLRVEDEQEEQHAHHVVDAEESSQHLQPGLQPGSKMIGQQASRQWIVPSYSPLQLQNVNLSQMLQMNEQQQLGKGAGITWDNMPAFSKNFSQHQPVPPAQNHAPFQLQQQANTMPMKKFQQPQGQAKPQQQQFQLQPQPPTKSVDLPLTSRGLMRLANASASPPPVASALTTGLKLAPMVAPSVNPNPSPPRLRMSPPPRVNNNATASSSFDQNNINNNNATTAASMFCSPPPEHAGDDVLSDIISGRNVIRRTPSPRKSTRSRPALCGGGMHPARIAATQIRPPLVKNNHSTTNSSSSTTAKCDPPLFDRKQLSELGNHDAAEQVVHPDEDPDVEYEVDQDQGVEQQQEIEMNQQKQKLSMKQVQPVVDEEEENSNSCGDEQRFSPEEGDEDLVNEHQGRGRNFHSSASRTQLEMVNEEEQEFYQEQDPNQLGQEEEGQDQDHDHDQHDHDHVLAKKCDEEVGEDNHVGDAEVEEAKLDPQEGDEHWSPKTRWKKGKKILRQKTLQTPGWLQQMIGGGGGAPGGETETSSAVGANPNLSMMSARGTGGGVIAGPQASTFAFAPSNAASMSSLSGVSGVFKMPPQLQQQAAQKIEALQQAQAPPLPPPPTATSSSSSKSFEQRLLPAFLDLLVAQHEKVNGGLAHPPGPPAGGASSNSIMSSTASFVSTPSPQKSGTLKEEKHLFRQLRKVSLALEKMPPLSELENQLPKIGLEKPLAEMLRAGLPEFQGLDFSQLKRSLPKLKSFLRSRGGSGSNLNTAERSCQGRTGPPGQLVQQSQMTSKNPMLNKKSQNLVVFPSTSQRGQQEQEKKHPDLLFLDQLQAENRELWTKLSEQKEQIIQLTKLFSAFVHEEATELAEQSRLLDEVEQENTEQGHQGGNMITGSYVREQGGNTTLRQNYTKISTNKEVEEVLTLGDQHADSSAGCGSGGGFSTASTQQSQHEIVGSRSCSKLSNINKGASQLNPFLSGSERSLSPVSRRKIFDRRFLGPNVEISSASCDGVTRVRGCRGSLAISPKALFSREGATSGDDQEVLYYFEVEILRITPLEGGTNINISSSGRAAGSGKGNAITSLRRGSHSTTSCSAVSTSWVGGLGLGFTNFLPAVVPEKAWLLSDAAIYPSTATETGGLEDNESSQTTTSASSSKSSLLNAVKGSSLRLATHAETTISRDLQRLRTLAGAAQNSSAHQASTSPNTSSSSSNNGGKKIVLLGGYWGRVFANGQEHATCWGTDELKVGDRVGAGLRCSNKKTGVAVLSFFVNGQLVLSSEVYDHATASAMETPPKACKNLSFPNASVAGYGGMVGTKLETIREAASSPEEDERSTAKVKQNKEDITDDQHQQSDVEGGGGATTGTGVPSSAGTTSARSNTTTASSVKSGPITLLNNPEQTLYPVIDCFGCTESVRWVPDASLPACLVNSDLKASNLNLQIGRTAGKSSSKHMSIVLEPEEGELL
ncbi:unnamed protein product [Amoebophrya sp. A25]|nr:unnamed protein product [Amoebophrya sp. A25]|eukprot:GSA25T00020933001.1